MASPVIVRIDGVPASLAPGESCNLTIVATDADTEPTNLRVKVQDEEGNESEWSPVVIQVNDTLTASGEILSGGGSLVPTGPLTFRYTA